MTHKNNTRSIHGGRFRGFTLIELLVVIAIISLLVSILLPSLTKAKELAKQVTCASTQRQIAISSQLYYEDYQPYLPRVLSVVTTPSGESTWSPWFATIGPYFGDYTTWPTDEPDTEELQRAGLYCPSYTKTPTLPTYKSKTGYGMNAYIPETTPADIWDSTDPIPWPKMDAVKQTAMMPLVADSRDYHLGEFWHIQFYADPNFAHPFNVERHMNGESCNVVFCDSHVESIPSERFIGGTKAENEAEVLKFFEGR